MAKASPPRTPSEQLPQARQALEVRRTKAEGTRLRRLRAAFKNQSIVLVDDHLCFWTGKPEVEGQPNSASSVAFGDKFRLKPVPAGLFQKFAQIRKPEECLDFATDWGLLFGVVQPDPGGFCIRESVTEWIQEAAQMRRAWSAARHADPSDDLLVDLANTINLAIVGHIIDRLEPEWNPGFTGRWHRVTVPCSLKGLLWNQVSDYLLNRRPDGVCKYCAGPVKRKSTGPPKQYCSNACRQASWRNRVAKGSSRASRAVLIRASLL